MSEFAISKDGTRIGYDQYGEGPAVVLVGGAMQFRGFDPNTVEMAKLLAAKGFTVFNYDRRGRGESAEAPSFSLKDNIDDLAALIDIAGGKAALFGSSSGGSIALAAAAAGLPVSKLALWETPLSDELGTGGAEFFAGLQERIASGDKASTIEYYMKDMPPEWLAGAKNSPGWPIMLEMGPSLSADAESLAWTQSAPRAQLWSGITQPTLAIVGEQTIPIMPKAADSIVANIQSARKTTIPGANHGWEPGVMAHALAEFLAD
jgi:pimeloyl-ACP methyl ester carboxylesterase